MSELKVEPASETWNAVVQEIDKAIQGHREAREQTGLDLRALDGHLAAIKALQSLKKLPERQSKKTPEPLRGSGVRVPGLHHSITS